MVSFTILDNLSSNPVEGFIENSFFQLAFPDNDNEPPFCFQLTPYFLIPFLIPHDLDFPELRIGLGNSIVLTSFMAMPKAAMNKNHSAVLGKKNVRFTRKTFVIYPITESIAPQNATKY